MAKLLAHREKPIPSLGADVPREIKPSFEKMVAKKVERPLPDDDAVVADLQKCQAAIGPIGFRFANDLARFGKRPARLDERLGRAAAQEQGADDC